MLRLFRTAPIVVVLIALSATAAFAHANADHDNDTDIVEDHMNYAEPVLFDGDVTTDCTVVGRDLILWELTGSDEVTYAELHIDEPEYSVTTRTATPYIWVTPRYDLDALDADADRIVGAISPDARLRVTICDATDPADTSGDTPWLPAATGIAGAALGMIGGRRLSGARSTS